MDKMYVESAKKDYLYNIYERGIKKKDNLKYKRYSDATILPVKIRYDNGQMCGNVGVLNNRNEYVAESYVDNLFHSGYDAEEVDYIDKTVVYCGTDHGVWGHFLVNVVPRLWIVLEQKIDIDEFIIVRSKNIGKTELLSNEIEFLELLGILDKVRVLIKPTRFKEVIVPESSYQVCQNQSHYENCNQYSEKFIQTFKCVVKKGLEKCKDISELKRRQHISKIFLSRSGLSPMHRHDSGIEVVDSLFRNNGYEIVYPERISLIELIFYLQHCKKIAYLSGTLQHNMLFAPQGISTISIERKVLVPCYQTDIDLIKELSVTYVSANYTFWPGNVSISGMYAWTSHLYEFVRAEGFCFPDYLYMREGFLQETIRKYMSEFEWCEEWKRVSLILPMYFATIRENRAELLKKLRLTDDIPIVDYRNVEVWKKHITKTLMKFQIPYSLWQEKNELYLSRIFARWIELAIRNGKTEFLIYPFGACGGIFVRLLEERYGICPKAIFDNKLSEYRKDIYKLPDIIQ